MSPDDEVLRPADYEFYRIVEKWEAPREVRDPAQLTLDANKAHDNIKVLVLERDRLQEAVIKLNKSLEREKQWRNWLTTALILTWTSWAGVAWWVTKVLAPVIVKGLSH